jgi:hypothetical protein
MLRREPGMTSITTHIPPAATAAPACSLDKGERCCPFFGFDLTVGDDTITLVATFPDGLSPASWEW